VIRKLLVPALVAGLAAPAPSAGDPVPLGPLGGSADSVVVDPADDDVVLVAKQSGLQRSTDGGQTFEPFGTGLPAGAARVLRPDPQDPDRLFVEADGTLFESLDFGASWAPTGLSASLRDLAVPASGSTLLATDSSTVYRSTDGGATWNVVANGSIVDPVAFAPADPSIAYYGSIDGLFRSTDGGASWAPTAFTDWTQSLTVSPDDADTVFAGSNAGVSRSTDGAATFTPVNDGLPGFANTEFFVWDEANGRLWLALLDGLWFTTNLGDNWIAGNAGFPPQPPIPLGMDIGGGGDMYVVAEASNGGLWKADDGQPPWVHVGFGEVFVIDVAIAGPGGPRVASSFNGVFAGASGQTLTSTSWQADFGTDTEDIAIDPSDPDRWVTGGVGAFIDNAQIVVLTNGGANAVKTYEQLGAGQVEDVAFDPNDPDVVLAGIFPGSFGNPAIIRSTNGGQGWVAIGGTAGWATRSLAWDPHQPGRVLELSDNGQWAESTDGGASWTPLQPAFVPTTGPSAFLAFDPFLEDVLYRGESGGGLWRSDDGGATWTSLGLSVHLDSDLALHPDVPGLLWTSDADGNVWISGDRGDTFVQAFEVAGAVASGLDLDPSDGTLMVGTQSQSAFEIPDASPYLVPGPGTEGTGGFVPSLEPVGGLPQPGNGGWGLAGRDLLGGSSAFLFVGLTGISVPVAGGTFFAGPPYVLDVALPTGGAAGVGGSGAFELAPGLPADDSLLGVTVVAQLAVLDAGGPGPGNKVLSNGLDVTFGP